MDYKSLFNRYKEGTASEEEKMLVEQELEKYKAIEEYLSDIMDDELSDFTKMGYTEPKDEETRKLKKNINKRLRKVITTSVLLVVLLYITIFYGISNIINKVYYEPTAYTQSEKGENSLPDFYYDMQAYISLNMPGYSIYSLIFQESKGFGNYELSYSLLDLFTNKDQRYFLNLSRGRLTSTLEGISSTKNRVGPRYGFESIEYNSASDTTVSIIDNLIKQRNEETFRYLTELNPLSYISMNITFDKDLTMEELYELIKETPLEFKWVGVRTVEPGIKWSENQPMHLIGFNPSFYDEPITYQSPDSQKYPFFNLDMNDIFNKPSLSETELQEAIVKAYETHFRSRLQYLRNREEFIKIFDYNEYKIDFYDYSLKYINEHGVKTYGVLVYGTAEEFIEYMDKIPYYGLYINEVLPAKPNIYYE